MTKAELQIRQMRSGSYYVTLALDAKVERAWGPFQTLRDAERKARAVDRWMLAKGAAILSPQQAKQ